jgi:hypothetical protein
MKRLDLTGQRFGRLTVISFSHQNKGKSYWKCKCDCGNEVIIYANHLKTLHTQSCGCYQQERTSISSITHGLRRTRFYRIWSHLKERCLNKNTKNYNDYGGRGIKLKWQSFEQFKEDMYESYLDHVKEFGEKQTTIDRIDNNGNYCKENCRWVNQKIQQNNKRTNHFIEYKGQVKTIAEWAEELNIKYHCLYARIMRNQPLEKSC